jgi:hypothetical protein
MILPTTCLFPSDPLFMIARTRFPGLPPSGQQQRRLRFLLIRLDKVAPLAGSFGVRPVCGDRSVNR